MIGAIVIGIVVAMLGGALLWEARLRRIDGREGRGECIGAGVALLLLAFWIGVGGS